MKCASFQLAALLGTFCLASAQSPAKKPSASSESRADRKISAQISVPVNQVLTPAGIQVELPGLRPQVIALSPDGNLLVTSGKTHELIVVHPATGMIVQRVPFPSDKTNEPNPDAVSSHLLEPDEEGQLSYTGLV